jgi:hypothetical protein
MSSKTEYYEGAIRELLQRKYFTMMSESEFIDEIMALIAKESRDAYASGVSATLERVSKDNDKYGYNQAGYDKAEEVRAERRKSEMQKTLAEQLYEDYDKCDTCEVRFFDSADLNKIPDGRLLCDGCLTFEIEQIKKFGVKQ